MTTSVHAQDAWAHLDDLARVLLATTYAAMRAAACTIAYETRKTHPAAARVLLEPSDQGDWLAISKWLDAAGNAHEIALDDDAESAATHLYLAHIVYDPDGGAVPGLWQETRSPETYLLDIDRVLQDYDCPVVAEVLTVRDADGPSTLALTVMGVTPRAVAVTEHHVDAGRGWTWEDWTAMRDDALAAASPAMLPRLRQALTDPPGAQHVERPRGAAWLPASDGDS